jgi:uncharacterized protein YdaU (DUF1376 family)
MAKQPYIPLYTGDYLKDTRMLPLNVRGAWVDLMIFMWESKERGVLTATMPEFAMMMSCTLEEANFAIGLLFQKGVCDFEVLPNGMTKMISRRMVRDADLAKKRSEAGLQGGRPKNGKQNHKQNESKTKANSDNDIDNDNDNSIKEPHQKQNVPREPIINPDDYYSNGKQAFEEIRSDELMVERLLRVVRNEGYAACDEVTVIKAVRRFMAAEEAKPDFSVRPRDEVKKHLVNWIRTKANTLHING